MSEYSTIEIMEALELRNPMRTFFVRFFPRVNTHISETIEFDFKKGKRRMAPFVAPRVGGKVIKRDGFTTRQIKTPKIAPERIMTIDDISVRGLGENVYSRRTPAEREDELLARDISELEESIVNRKEWMAREIVLKGILDVQIPDEGVDIQVDFEFTNKTTLIGAAKWDSDSSDPLLNLNTWRRAIISSTGKAPAGVIMGAMAFGKFKTNKKVKEAMNILNMTFGKIEPRVVDEALTFCGHIAEINLDIYTYDEWFVDDDGKEQAMLPDNTIIIVPDVIGSFEYGSVTVMDEDCKFKTYEGELVPEIYPDRKNSSKIVRITSRPLPRPDNVDSWYVAEVL